MELRDLSDFVVTGRGVLDLLKTAYSALPKGADRDAIEREIKKAEELLTRSDAKLAKDLGYKICQCTFPPQIMLWREKEKAWMCQNTHCGARIDRIRQPEADATDDYVNARRRR